MTTAAFRARNLTTSGAWSNFADGGFDAAAGDEIEVQLEGAPALDVWMTQFSDVDRSNGRTIVTFSPSTGIAATPTSGVTFTMPAAEVGTHSIQCQTNGGPQSADGTPDPDFTKLRFFAVRTTNLALRHPLYPESTEYEPDGPAVSAQEMIDAVDAGAAGAVTSVTAGAGLTGGGSGAVTINVAVNADAGLIVTANEMQLGTLGFTRVQTALAAASGSIAVNSQKITGLATPTANTDATTKAYVDALAFVPTTRTLTAGAGLTGGGTLASDRTFDIGANADGSIVVNANDVQVGVLASDAQHGTRGGGTTHANVIASGAAGFMTGVDKTKLDGIGAGAAVVSVGVVGPITNTGSATALVLNFAPIANVSMLGFGFTLCAGIENASGDATIMASGDVQLRASGSLSVLTGLEERIAITNTGQETRRFDDGATITRNFGGVDGTRVTFEAENDFTTSSATPINVLSFALPNNITALATMYLTATDISTGDAAVYERKYKVKRHNAGAAALGTAADVLIDEDDATWGARLVLATNTLHLEWTGDTTNQVNGRARWVLDYHTYTPI